MSDELETAALGSVGGLSKPSSGDSSSDTPEACRNCGEPVHRKYCGACGQLATNYHRPIFSLLAEILGDFLSLDGRVAHTIPALLFNPGHITRLYLDGKRQRFVPPFRLYLLASFLFFLTLFSFGETHGWFQSRVATVASQTNGVSSSAEVVTPEPPATPDAGLIGDDGNHLEWSEVLDEEGNVDRDYVKERLSGDASGGEADNRLVDVLVDGAADVYENQQLFFAAIKNWAPRLALGLTPALILCLILVFPFRRSIYIYDHVITALHFQTWLYFVTTLSFLLLWVGQGWGGWVVSIVMPIYLYRLMRRVYGAGHFLGVVRAVFIIIMLSILLGVWFFGVLVLSAEETSGFTR